MIERAHLAIIREIARQGSLTAAAEVLCLTQSALSHAMKKLEQQVGAPLWRREGRRLRLTQAGEHLLGVANRLLPQLEQAEDTLRQFARGERGLLRIGMECHPCHEWLLRVVAPYLAQWPDVDVDVKQAFQFGGIGGLFAHEIDLLVTPDPLHRPGLHFEPVFAYELVLAVAHGHRLAGVPHIEPEQLVDEVLISYPVPTDRLDLYTRFLLPAGVRPRRRKLIETTDIMLQMVAGGRGVAALPRWLVDEYADRIAVTPRPIGPQGIVKDIHLGIREADRDTDYFRAFFELARASDAHVDRTATGNA
ncbi:LysR family transcriptional regulator [Acidihalobacter ferrooxydans]|uniref:HTH-type transcriptional regulator MetR n=2 Tax=Acidihalobacter ferrooxydans TaxID=1765967 RepID=A0A1P8UJH7_9GAMM|nr:LysR family transcriptional regulator [Acidihalobacter ferrooxydans]